MNINSAIMLELARQRHLDVAHGVAKAQRPAPARHGSTSVRRPVYRTRLALVTAVVAGTLTWGAFVTGLAGLTPTPTSTATGTEVTATALQARTASVTMTRPTRTVNVTPRGHYISTPSGHHMSTPKGHYISTPYVRSTPDHGNWS